jgi:hypothetical protein
MIVGLFIGGQILALLNGGILALTLAMWTAPLALRWLVQVRIKTY